MGGIAGLVAAIALGLDVGWQPHPDGGLEYIIQIEPHALESLRTGEDIESVVPPSLRGVRAYRITVGTAKPPRVGAIDDAPGQPEPEKSALDLLEESQRAANPVLPFGPFGDQQKWSGLPAEEAEKPVDGAPLPNPGISLPPLDTRADENELPSFFPKSERPVLGSELPTDSPVAAPQSRQPDSRPFNSSSGMFGADDSAPPSRLPARPAVHIEEAEDGPSAEVPETLKEEAVEEEAEKDAEPSKPWLPLTLAMAGLFGSLGGMLYFGWIAWDYRIRYRSLLERVIQTGRDYEPALEGPDASVEDTGRSRPDAGY